jgi:hypothetical protein
VIAAPIAWIRRTRPRALLARQLENWDAVWSAYELEYGTMFAASAKGDRR